MTAVFIHGVPETLSLWNGVRAHLSGDSVALRLPGFGSPRPARLRDKDAYAAWLADELRSIGGPIDLVGHEWGGHLTLRVVTALDVPVRSWVSDVVHGWHPTYEWHWAAKVWQTPDSEASLTAIREAEPGSGRTFGDILQSRGLTPQLAKEVDAAHGHAMSAAILALYRSAAPNLHADWGAQITGPTTIPGLVIIPAADRMGDETRDLEMAEKLGAHVERLDGLTHYWMLQDPARGAAALQRFWVSLTA
ncbi:alpha/beta fold hydrolase [Nonomuraea indica]|uniref:Alpha/beta fold hydrolase n=1 Tax=Nonomuraea indica TaxID=1581193 RepID=A0ABW8A8W3_9ACTN